MTIDVDRVGVVGAGAMGGGIAYVFSAAGMSVSVKDIVPEQLELARAHLAQIYARRVARGRLSQREMEEGLARVRYTLAYDAFADVDLVIEAVPERMAVKRAVFAELGQVCPPRAILASNTSALSITEMGRAAGRPNRVLGMHFFNPAHVMRLVEVIPGQETKQEVVERVVQLAQSLGKTPVVVRECPGFLVNRLLMPYLNEAVVCLQEGAATVAAIDAAMGRDGFGWPMGPFALMDMLGLDVCHHILAYLDAAYGERLQEAALLRNLSAAGQLGEKSGGGFYAYPGQEASAKVDAWIEATRAQGCVEHLGSRFSPERLMAVLLNESFLCVQEGIATVEDIDTACIAGLGMAVREGQERVPIGPLAYADRCGLDVLLDQFLRLQEALGARFAPAPILAQEVAAGHLGVSSGRGFGTYEQ
ncbi:MAG: 3-hydroxyacyl-CoA dehydrogenase [Anaerolineae bacterium]|nr:3-hydroxyacyl-CoA dehydrogenase [Anaerolineae bacterium]